MNDSHVTSISQLEQILKATNLVSFKGISREEGYDWISKTLCKFKYFTLSKKEKCTIKNYIILMTGYSDAQLTRLIDKQKSIGEIKFYKARQNRFKGKYTSEDVALLAETDEAHSRLSGPATKRIFQRMYDIYEDKRFERLKDISVGQIYILRARRWYLSKTRFFTKTKRSKVSIGERRKPNPQGKPGFLRVDTVHQGDKSGQKGVYHINITDEVTQWEIVRAAQNISHNFVVPILQNIIEKCPFKVLGFHSDNGSEYINKNVAYMLNEQIIKQTKSRSLKSNDNALAESKNGAVIRKHMGYAYIPQEYADPINRFYREYFDEYLNFHRPCGFATINTDKKGKERKIYNIYLTPYEKFRSIKNAKSFLKKGITFKDLDRISIKKSDNECASQMQKAKRKLLTNITY